MPAILATDAKRMFGHVLDQVSQGEVYTVTRRGKPVARIVPMDYQSQDNQFGALAAFANTEKQSLESDAFARAMETKHGAR